MKLLEYKPDHFVNLAHMTKARYTPQGTKVEMVEKGGHGLTVPMEVPTDPTLTLEFIKELGMSAVTLKGHQADVAVAALRESSLLP